MRAISIEACEKAGLALRQTMHENGAGEPHGQKKTTANMVTTSNQAASRVTHLKSMQSAAGGNL